MEQVWKLSTCSRLEAPQTQPLSSQRRAQRTDPGNILGISTGPEAEGIHCASIHGSESA